jgi:hypothetical protein
MEAGKKREVKVNTEKGPRASGAQGPGGHKKKQQKAGAAQLKSGKITTLFENISN